MTLYAAYFTNQPEKFNQVFSAGRLQQLSSWCHFYPQTITDKNIAARRLDVAKTEVMFSI